MKSSGDAPENGQLLSLPITGYEIGVNPAEFLTVTVHYEVMQALRSIDFDFGSSRQSVVPSIWPELLQISETHYFGTVGEVNEFTQEIEDRYHGREKPAQPVCDLTAAVEYLWGAKE